MAYKLNPFTGLFDITDWIWWARTWVITMPDWDVNVTSVQSFIDLFFQSSSPSIVISVDPNNYLREYWNNVVDPSISVIFSPWSNPESQIANYEYKRDNTVIHNWTIDWTFQDNHTVTNKTIYRIIATDWEWRTATWAETYSFVYPFFRGYASTGDITDWITESNLQQLWWISKHIVKKWNKSTYTTLEDAKFVFMYPSSYWVLRSILDQNWFETISDYNKSTITVTSMLDWSDKSYYYYELKSDTTQDNFKNTYKF